MGLMAKLRRATRNTGIARAARSVRNTVERTADAAQLGGIVRTVTRSDLSTIYNPARTARTAAAMAQEGIKLAPRIGAAIATGGTSEIAYAANAANALAGDSMGFNLGGVISSAANMYQSYSSGQPITSGQINSAMVAAGAARRTSAKPSAPTISKAKASKSDLDAGRLATGAPPASPRASFELSPMMLAAGAIIAILLLQR